MLVLFIAHHALNGAWYRNLFRGKYTGVRILTSAVDTILDYVGMYQDESIGMTGPGM